jgi:2-methylcitrate dehydratase PrpD
VITGAHLKVGKIAIEYARSQGGKQEAQVAGTKFLTTAVNAAQANGMLAHADETDDSNQPGASHPGCVVVPAALAIAEKHGRSGADLLSAVVLGYDILVRVNKSLGVRALRDRGHGPYSIGGAWGAAATAGLLARFDETQCKHLLSNIAQQTSGIATWMFDAEHTEKAFHFGGMPARNGVSAVSLVEAGFTGVPDVLSGPRNFLFAFCDNPKPAQLYRALGQDFEIMHANIKKWSVGSPIQAVLDSTQALIRKHKIGPDDVAAVTIYMAPGSAETVADRTMPDINAPHCASLMLVDGNVTFKSTHDYGRVGDPQILAMKRRIKSLPSEMLGRAKPARQAIVEIRTKEGRKVKHRTYKVRGTQDDPMTRGNVTAKAEDLLVDVMGASRAKQLIERIWTIEKTTQCQVTQAVARRLGQLAAINE